MVKVLTGWKEIAGALSVSVRTAQTLRLSHGLPVANLTARMVMARADDLDEWSCRVLAPLRTLTCMHKRANNGDPTA